MYVSLCYTVGHGDFMSSTVHILVWSSSFLPHHSFLCWWADVSFLSLWDCVSLRKKFIFIHFLIIPRSDIIWCLSVSVSVTLLRMIISTFFSVTGLGIISYFLMVEKYCIVYLYLYLYLKFIQLACFPDLAVAPCGPRLQGCLLRF